MSQELHAGGDERFVRRYEYDDSVVVAVDFGVADDAVDVDIVGSTAIVVVDTGDSVTETEFELPGTDTDTDTDTVVATHNGVLTITVPK